MTETKKRGVESVEELDAKIREPEAEQAADTTGCALTWEEVTSTTADELDRRDKAHGEWALTLSAVQSADGRTGRTARELGPSSGGRGDT